MSSKGIFLRWFSCLLLAFAPSLKAQTFEQYLQAAGDYAALYHGRIEPGFPLKAWMNHPYWDNKDFVQGDVCFEGRLYRNVWLRYDIYRNWLAVLSPVKGINILPDQDKIDYFVIDGKPFVPINGHYNQILREGRHVALVHRRVKSRGGDVIRDMHTYHYLDQKDDYFLLTPDSTLLKLKNVKDLIEAYPQYKQLLRNNSRKAKHKYNAKLIESSLCEDVIYLDQLLAADSSSPLFTSQTPRTPRTLQILQNPLSPPLLAPDSIFSNEPVEVRSYQAYLGDNRPQYDEEETFSESDIFADLEPIREDHILDEVTVRGFQQKVNNAQVGMEKFRPAQLRNIPLALGEADVMKVVQTLPGVKTMGEASSGFNVRGGAADQNLILLNGNTVFNPMHMFGIFSAFNSDMVGETELYKSGIPAQYGGRISSVMDIHNRNADWKEFHGSASIGLVTSKANLEIPIVPEHASLLVGGRSTYSDWMLDMIPEKSGYRNGKAGFWDLSATLATAINRDHRINAYFYTSHDRFSFSPFSRYGYSNLNGSLEWKSRYSSRVNSSFNIGMDHYDYHNEETEKIYEAARLSFNINQWFARANVNIAINDSHQLQVGLHSQFYLINPGTYEPVGDDSFIAFRELDEDKAIESALFAEDSWQVMPRLKVIGGLRYNLFNALREGKTHTYQSPEIRLSASYKLAEDQSVKASFNTMHQFIHKVSNTSIMSPTDTWTLSNSRIKPQDGWQVAAGYYYQTHNAKYEVNIEAYYKQMNNYLTYRSAGQLLMNPDLENDVLGVRGRAYGVELQLKKDVGMLTGWISYSYSRTELQQDDASAALAINGGAWFPAEYDRPHELKFVGNYKFTHRYSLSMNLDYSTGRPTTIPAGQYFNQSQGRFLPFYTERNGYRMPDYFRVDASFNIEPSHHLTALFHSWISIGCYNLLARKNAYSIYYLGNYGSVQGYKLSIFGAPIPFVSYNIKF
ncbi:MAG: TonB-dependent receptor plug domain-containing protein [Bacteroidales bacterium]|nr:TonB-dependent receptor plug domain-containing protein [Bacteroidales bacterium]